MDLPKPISDFFLLKNNHDDKGLLSLFTDDAVVVDAGEGKTMNGMKEINAWIQKSISGLNLHTDIQTSQEQASKWIINAITKGDFPGSPALFEYFITLDKHKISSLRVEFRGFLNK